DADRVECLPNDEIFDELARMGYEKPPSKLTFYKVFFSVQWKFLIHTIVQCMSAKRTTWNKFSSSMGWAIIRLATGRKFNFSKYIFDSMFWASVLIKKSNDVVKLQALIDKKKVVVIEDTIRQDL
nr:ribonuclease H-like domain, reverse transcriptase, RNA-dependent DNA polymerase [Tanacetum cinerariifolium]